MDHPIEWLVLDRQDDRLLLLCKRALETMPYHDTEMVLSQETSSLRAWLNGAFLDSAFLQADEAARILLTEIDNSCVNPEYILKEAPLLRGQGVRSAMTKLRGFCRKTP